MRLLNLKNIVVATDLESSSHTALDTAYRLAQASGATLHVVHAIADDDADPEAGSASATEAVLEAMRAAGIPRDPAHVDIIRGTPAEAIGAFAHLVAADVIILGPHRDRDPETGGHTLGGTARDVVERADAPCLVAASPLRLPLRRVLVPTDLSDTARGALLVGISWASALRLGARAHAGTTTLEAFHVAVEPARSADESSRLDREIEGVRRDLGDWAGITVASGTIDGADVAMSIGQHADALEADLIVLGTRGRGADAEARLGSVSSDVTRHVRVPTLLVPPAVWRSYAESA